MEISPDGDTTPPMLHAIERSPNMLFASRYWENKCTSTEDVRHRSGRQRSNGSGVTMRPTCMVGVTHDDPQTYGLSAVSDRMRLKLCS